MHIWTAIHSPNIAQYWVNLGHRCQHVHSSEMHHFGGGKMIELFATEKKTPRRCQEVCDG